MPYVITTTTPPAQAPPEQFVYAPWRHGGWYVHNVRHPNGGCGCVSRNFPDKKWRIACDPRDEDHTHASRDDAARAEWTLTNTEVTQVAVVTLDEARIAAADACSEHHDPGYHGCDHTDAEQLPATGGTIGPLPDGTLIQVRPTGRAALALDAGVVLSTDDDDDTVCVKFNEAPATFSGGERHARV